MGLVDGCGVLPEDAFDVNPAVTASLPVGLGAVAGFGCAVEEPVGLIGEVSGEGLGLVVAGQTGVAGIDRGLDELGDGVVEDPPVCVCSEVVEPVRAGLR